MRYRPYRSPDNFTAQYPLLLAGWVQRICVTSETELAAAYALGFLISDSAISTILRGRAPEKETLLESLDRRPDLEKALDDKYFILLLINLFEQWFTYSTPRTALASLIGDFQESDLLRIGDGRLPTDTAGLYDPVDSTAKADLEDYLSKVGIQRWLGGYIETLVKHPLLRTSLL
jgi:hypothetical protein